MQKKFFMFFLFLVDIFLSSSLLVHYMNLKFIWNWTSFGISFVKNILLGRPGISIYGVKRVLTKRWIKINHLDSNFTRVQIDSEDKSQRPIRSTESSRATKHFNSKILRREVRTHVHNKFRLAKGRTKPSAKTSLLKPFAFAFDPTSYIISRKIFRYTSAHPPIARRGKMKSWERNNLRPLG